MATLHNYSRIHPAQRGGGLGVGRSVAVGLAVLAVCGGGKHIAPLQTEVVGKTKPPLRAAQKERNAKPIDTIRPCRGERSSEREESLEGWQSLASQRRWLRNGRRFCIGRWLCSGAGSQGRQFCIGRLALQRRLASHRGRQFLHRPAGFAADSVSRRAPFRDGAASRSVLEGFWTGGGATTGRCFGSTATGDIAGGRRLRWAASSGGRTGGAGARLYNGGSRLTAWACSGNAMASVAMHAFFCLCVSVVW
jgi:hypothetical protein